MAIKLNLPYYVDTPFGRRQFKTEAEARAFSAELTKTIEDLADKEIALYGMMLFAGIGYLGAKHPDKVAPLVAAFGTVLNSALEGTGKIIEGIGEVVPG